MYIRVMMTKGLFHSKWLISFLHEVQCNVLQLRQSDWTRQYAEVPKTVILLQYLRY